MATSIVFKMKHIPSTYDEHVAQKEKLAENGLDSEVHNNATHSIEFRPVFDDHYKLYKEVRAEWFFTNREPRLMSFSMMPKQALAALELFETQCILVQVTEDSEVSKRRIKGYMLRIRKYLVNGEPVIRLNYNTPNNGEAIDVNYDTFMKFFKLILS